jgi:hypothetical protein
MFAPGAGGGKRALLNLLDFAASSGESDPKRLNFLRLLSFPPPEALKAFLKS